MNGQLTDRYVEAKRLALAAAELAFEQREAFIARECAEDADLLREVQWMLQAIDSTHTATLPVLSAISPDLSGHDAQATAPRHYRLIRHLGEGGMGTVYLAERSDGDFVQQVALKLLAAGAEGSPILTERFCQERRLLARLEHPGIARLLDGGALADGKPFLAMEYVEGERIDAWCDRHRLDVHARVRLFLKVCAAVEYAHRNLIIHRDIKPANILVTEDGTPKLLDFGIARILDEHADVLATETAAHAMTLAYASPEQIERLPLTTAADVYSLGVVLYQLMAGQRPYQHLVTPHLLSNAIVGGNIVPPSRAARIGTSEAGAAARLGARGGVPRDIDAIVLKALRCKVDERYSSVLSLTADLRRFLARRPVLARRGRQLYRVRRFVQRNRWPLAAGSILLFAVLAGLIASLASLHQVSIARHLAERRQHQLERMVSFQQSMLDSVDIEAMGHALADAQMRRVQAALGVGGTPASRSSEVAKLRAALEQSGSTDIARNVFDTYVVSHALQSIDHAFADAPAMSADVRQSLAKVLLSIGSYEHAAEELRRVLRERQRARPFSRAKLISVQVDLGRALEEQGETEQAASSYKDAIKEAVALPWSDPLRVAAYAGSARVLVAQGHLAEALKRQQMVLGHAAAVLPPATSVVMRLRRDTIDTLVQLGRYGEAKAQMEPLVALDRAALGPENQETLNATLTLAKLERQQGSFELSMRLAKQVAAVREQRWGRNHPATMDAQYLVAVNETKLVNDEKGLDRVYSEIERIVRMRRAIYGPDNPRTVSAMTGMVALLIKQGDKSTSEKGAQSKYAEAAKIERVIVDSHERMLGRDHPNTILAHGSLASVLERGGAFKDALKEARYTLAAQERILGEDHPIVPGTLDLIGDILSDMGNLDGAEVAYRDALTRRDKMLGPAAALTVSSASHLYEVLVRRAKKKAALLVRHEYLDPIIAMNPGQLDASMRSVRDQALRLIDPANATAATIPSHPGSAIR